MEEILSDYMKTNEVCVWHPHLVVMVLGVVEQCRNSLYAFCLTRKSLTRNNIFIRQILFNLMITTLLAISKKNHLLLRVLSDQCSIT